MRTYEERTERIKIKSKEIKTKNAKDIKIFSIVACAVAAVLAFYLVLFIPYSVGGFNISEFADSEYYPVIERLSALTYSQETTTNNFNEWFGDISLSISGGRDDDPDYSDYSSGTSYGTTGASDSFSNAQTYEEVTNNQTEGVIEGDLFKRSNEYIYYLNYVFGYYTTQIDGDGNKTTTLISSHYQIEVYSIAGSDSELVGFYEIAPEDGTTYKGYEDTAELFLSQDCTTLTILTPCYDTTELLLYTSLITLDVSDVENITETNRVYVSGEYVSSRLTSENLLLVSNFSVKNNTDFTDEAQFLPQTGTLENLTSLPLDDIVLPESATSAAYTVICLIDPETLAVEDCVAFLSYSEEVYVSSENAYVTRSYSVTRVDDFINGNGYAIATYPVTDIVMVSYGDELTVENSVTVTGEINNQYSMDEYDGVLRVFTTSSYDAVIYTYLNSEDSALNGTSGSKSGLSYYISANLYCIDIGDMTTIASVEQFCPAGESVMSARFDGTTAYVCTAVIYEEIIEDPVYQFDLSDYDNITYTDTGTILGYSLSLITFTDDTLLGIGYGDSLETLNIVLYREDGETIITVAEYTREYASFSEEFKSYFIDAENGLIGLGLSYYDYSTENWSWFDGYVLLRYDGYNLVVVAEVEIDDCTPERTRADYIEGFLYILTPYTGLTVVAIG